MDKIGFKNFRNFEELPSIDLGGITVLLGGNNTGKSSLVKGALLMHDFIQTKNVKDEDTMTPFFMFNSGLVNIGSFFRAICRNKSNNGRTISFEYGLDDFTINVVVKGDRKADVAPKGEVSSIGINDTLSKIEINIDYNKNRIKIKFGAYKDEEEIELKRKKIEKEKSSLKFKRGYASFMNQKYNKAIDSLKEKEYNAKIEQLNKELEALDKQYSYQEEVVTIDLDEVLGYNSGDYLLPGLINAIVSYATEERLNINRPIFDNYSKDILPPQFIIRDREQSLKLMAERLSAAIENDVAEYIHAQSAILQDSYNIAQNPNDYATRAIDEYCQTGIAENDEEYDLICHWLSEFEIGTSIDVTSKKDGSFLVKVLDDKIKGGIDLVDMGIGSNQITILLLRIATIIRKYRDANVTIMVEDPERYLYPALQSKLADFLWDVNIRYGINFVVETHSEYLIRRSQVLVVKNLKTNIPVENPFKVYYVDKQIGIYPMNYRSNGKFDRKFGKGFFDVSNKAALELFDLVD